MPSLAATDAPERQAAVATGGDETAAEDGDPSLAATDAPERPAAVATGGDETAAEDGGDGGAPADSGITPPADGAAAASGGGHGWLVYLLSVLSAISSLLFGYDTGVVSGAMLLVRRQLHLSDLWHELIVSATVGAAGAAALLGGALADRLGRKPVILAAGALFVAGSVTMAAAGGREALLAGRLVVGVAIGLSSMSTPIYISESAPVAIRGLLVTMMASCITLGQLVASLVCGALSGVEDGWRWMLGLGAVPATLQLAGFAFMPESPRFLVSRGRDERAREVLRRVRGDPARVEAEFAAIKADFAAQEAAGRERAAAGAGRSVLAQVVREPSTRRALLAGCALQFFQQVSGVNTVVYYSASIITLAGVRDPATAIWLSGIVSLLSFAAKFAGMALVERAGRRPILLWSAALSIVSLLILGAGFQLSAAHSPPVTVVVPGETACRAATCDACEVDTGCGFCFQDLPAGPTNGSCVSKVSSYNASAAGGRCADPAALGEAGLTWAADWCPTDYAWLPIAGMFLYITAFSPGLGAMPWTITAEMFPLWARSTCCSITTSVNWCANLAVSLTFLTLIHAISRQGTFYLFASCTLLGLAVFYVSVPETKGVSLEEMQELFALPWGLHAPRRQPPRRGLKQGYDNMTFDPS